MGNAWRATFRQFSGNFVHSSILGLSWDPAITIQDALGRSGMKASRRHREKERFHVCSNLSGLWTGSRHFGSTAGGQPVFVATRSFCVSSFGRSPEGNRRTGVPARPRRCSATHARKTSDQRCALPLAARQAHGDAPLCFPSAVAEKDARKSGYRAGGDMCNTYTTHPTGTCAQNATNRFRS